MRIIPSIAFSLCLVASSSAAPSFTNGSLTGPIANNGVPPGWTISAESPDTMDENNNAGVMGLQGFVATPSGPSPDGGTWVGLGRDDAASFLERFGQSVSGFTLGGTYMISWFQGNFGYADYNQPNGIEVLINAVSAGLGPIIPTGSNWSNGSVSFVASASTLNIDFQLSSGARSYFSIDGITVAPVPEPSSRAMVLLSGVGLLAVYRSRLLRSASRFKSRGAK